MSEHPVKVHIYDMSKGLARSMSYAILGRQIDGVWHTGIVVYGEEYFFGGMGIESCPPNGTILGQPDTVVDLGVTQIPKDMFMDYLHELSNTSFRPEKYHLLEHNCNNFSNEVAHFLTGNNIPSYVVSLPQEVLATPLGAMLKPMVEAMQVNAGGGHQVFPDSVDAANSPAPFASTATAAPAKANEPSKPTIYNERQNSSKFSSEKSCLCGKCSSENLKLFEDMAEYIATDECNWSLSVEHLRAVDEVVRGGSINNNEACLIIGLLQQAILKEDIVHLLRSDKQHHFMSLVNHLCASPKSLQLILAKTLCNCLSWDVGHKWAVDPSSWTLQSDTVSNSKISRQTCVHCLLSDDSQLLHVGSSLALNMTRLEASEDIHIEVGSALIQALGKDLDHATADQCLIALNNCMASPEVTGLAKAMGLDLSRYKDVPTTSKEHIRQMTDKLQTFSI